MEGRAGGGCDKGGQGNGGTKTTIRLTTNGDASRGKKEINKQRAIIQETKCGEDRRTNKDTLRGSIHELMTTYTLTEYTYELEASQKQTKYYRRPTSFLHTLIIRYE